MIQEVENNGRDYYVKGRYSLEDYFTKVDKNFNEIIPPYQLIVKYDNSVPINFGFANWVEEEPGTLDAIYIKKPFSTYIDEQKPFDAMFSVRPGNREIYPLLVVKNYFKNSEYNSLSSPTLIMSDIHISLSTKIGGYGGKYQAQELAIKAGTSITGYRTVWLHNISFDTYAGFNKDKEKFLTEVINAIKPGKVFITYETSTGQIKRTFTEAQVKGLKEMFQIYYNFLFNKFEKKYINEEVKKECEALEAEVAERNKDHDIRMQPIIEMVNKFREEYGDLR
jgi:hypothetical protein